MMKSMLNIDLNKSCRICLTQQNAHIEMHQIFMDKLEAVKDTASAPLYLKIMSCAPVQVRYVIHNKPVAINKVPRSAEQNS